jgi:hypothetical protein
MGAPRIKGRSPEQRCSRNRERFDAEARPSRVGERQTNPSELVATRRPKLRKVRFKCCVRRSRTYELIFPKATGAMAQAELDFTTPTCPLDGNDRTTSRTRWRILRHASSGGHISYAACAVVPFAPAAPYLPLNAPAERRPRRPVALAPVTSCRKLLDSVGEITPP